MQERMRRLDHRWFLLLGALAVGGYALLPVPGSERLVLDLLGLGAAMVLATLAALAIRRRGRVERALDIAERRFRSLVEDVADAMLVLDAAGRITSASPAIQRILAHRAEDLAGRSLGELIHPEDADRVTDAVRALATEPRMTREIELRIRDASGEWRWADVRFTDRLGDPAIGGIVAALRETTARRAAEEALRESERRFRDLLEGIPLLAVILDRAGRITFCNGFLLALTGFAREELIGRDWIEATVAGDEADRGAAFRHAVATGTVAAHADAPIATRSGDRRTVAWTNTVLRDAAGDPIGVASIGEDVTEQRRIQDSLRESEVQYHALFEENHAVMLLSDPQSGVIVDANPAACAFYGYRRERLLLMKLADISAQTEDEVFEEMQRASDERRSHFRFRHRLADGEVRYVEVYTGPVTIRGRLVLYSLVFDVTERRRAEEGLRESERRFRAVFDGVPIGVARLDTAGRIVEVNPAMRRLFKRQSEEFQETRLAEHMADEEVADASQLFEELSRGVRDHYEIERRYRRRDGGVFWGRTSTSLVRDSGGLPLFAIAMIEDVTDRKRAEEELTHRAMHDVLTGLANRALFLDRLEVALARREHRSGEVAVLFLDLDGFKAVNDTLGHEAGDELLVAAAGRIEGCVRPSDTVARFGGDEFVVLCDGIEGEGDAEAVARRISAALGAPFDIGERRARVTASIGIALSIGPGDEPEGVIRDADQAMYLAKQRGRARWVVAERAQAPAPRTNSIVPRGGEGAA